VGLIWPATILLSLSTKIGALKPNASMLLAIAVICAGPCLRGLCGSGIKSPIATNKICRRVATWAAVGIEAFSFGISQTQLGLSLVGEEAEEMILWVL